jgi:hypothetical protein
MDFMKSITADLFVGLYEPAMKFRACALMVFFEFFGQIGIKIAHNR